MFFFFFQAEDGIRDKLVTGVQTCALPISRDIVADGAYVFDQLGYRVVDADGFVEQLAVTLDGDENILINGRTEHCPIFAVIKISQVRSASGKTDAQRRAGDHKPRPL